MTAPLLSLSQLIKTWIGRAQMINNILVLVSLKIKKFILFRTILYHVHTKMTKKYEFYTKNENSYQPCSSEGFSRNFSTPMYCIWSPKRRSCLENFVTGFNVVSDTQKKSLFVLSNRRNVYGNQPDKFHLLQYHCSISQNNDN